ncbi:SCO family protein [Alkalilimnicola ehrlichii MLHE-1]|uniref:Electron transport protein SCO1/SenC n=1 Tax=Alkalilimnicola ehrlichii (strain ATCC BAA-1101 / DSM 17681 / MLHE-1) TaxID=187272 RepID=Q0A7M8_ALKEH|nr:SCO family protein [Alkalilimnicola ehrlichii]ABI57159.1 electron transport protein SCO1/SenC [Alkalilimnicola ehrlichii MLHE-1]
MKGKPHVTALLILLILLLLGTLYWLVVGMAPSEPEGADGGHERLELVAEPVGGDFTLISKQGEVSLSDFEGKLVLIYFGYVFCPDVCPDSLARVAAALEQLDDEARAQVQPLFVSIDPERDTLDHLDHYARWFHEDIVGLTGDPEVIREIADRYGAAYRKVEEEGQAGYLVDHSSFFYLVDRQGELDEILPHGMDPAEMAAALRAAL